MTLLPTTKRALCLLGIAAWGLAPAMADNNSIDPPTYAVNRVEADPPVIDGVVSEGEWDAAAAAAGDWVELRTHEPDTHNLRFQMMWDNTHLYILGQSDWDGFNPPRDSLENPNFEGFSYTPNMYFDPNRDGEDLDTLPRIATEIDGYQIAWSVESGFFARQPTTDDPQRSLRDPLSDEGDILNDYISGLAVEAHVNDLFGNQGLISGVGDNSGPNGNWRDDHLPGLVFAQNADNADVNGSGQAGAVWEFAIAWDVFDATNPNRKLTEEDAELGDVGDPDPRFADPESPEFLESGLYAVQPPVNGEVWAFEMGVITNDLETTWLPSWSEPEGGDPLREGFSAWGNSAHGRLTFVNEPTGPVCDPNTGGDLNGDGAVSFPDFLILSANFSKQVDSHTQGDIDCDGQVAFPDFLVLSSAFGVNRETAQSVPEPQSGWLLLSATLGVALARRRRR